MFPFSLGSFAFVDDLDDDYSSVVTGTTYVDRRPSRDTRSTPKPRESRDGREKDTKRSKSKVDKDRDEKRRSESKARGGKSFPGAGETIAKRSSGGGASLSAPGRISRRRSSSHAYDERKGSDRLKAVDDEKDNDETLVVGDRLSSKLTDRSPTARARSRDTGRDTYRDRVTEPTERMAKSEPMTEDVRRENRSLKRRVTRLEKDLGAYRKHVEHYRERRREAEHERVKAVDHSKELKQVVNNLRESYDKEMDDLREQMAKAATTAAAAAVASVSAEAYVQAQNTGPTSTVREPSVHAPSNRRAASHVAPSHVSSHRRTPSRFEHAVQTSPLIVPAQLTPRARHPPTGTPFSMPKPLATDVEVPPSTLLLQLEERDAELRALKLTHDEKPQMLLSDLAAEAYKLNTEIRSLAALVSESVPLGRTWEVAQAWALEAAEPSLEICLRILSDVKGADFARDPTLVRLALQAWLVMCLQRVFDRFLFGLEDTEDETFRSVYDRLQAHEPMTVAARWRALTRRHARVLAARVASSPVNPTQQSNFRVAQSHAIYTLETQILVGFRDIMRFAGAHSAPGDLLIELRRLHSHHINRCVCRAVRLAKDVAERAPTGCEMFAVPAGKESERQRPVPPRSGIPQETLLCGCMENADTECRQWVGQRKRKSGPGTHHRGGTATSRSKSTTHTRKTKTQSRAGTATTRTWADTHIRQWDRDSADDVDQDQDDNDDVEVNSDSDSEIDEAAEHEDEFVEGVDATRYGDGSVVCSLGFGLRRVMNNPKPATSTIMGRSVSERDQERDRERRRSRQPRADTVNDTSELKSTYTKLTTTVSSSASTSVVSEGLTERPPLTSGHSVTENTNTHTGTGAPSFNTAGVSRLRRTTEVLVKTDVLMSSTLDTLQRRFGA